MVFTTCVQPTVESNEPFSGAIATASPEATKAGEEILKKGGNAIDAAIAISFALGVTEPAMSGIGGGTQILLALPGEPPIAINGASISPAATLNDATKDDLTYHRRSTIPSTVKILGYVHEKYGSGNVQWAELLTPAIKYAEEGFEVGRFRHMVYKKYEKILKKSPHNAHFLLLPDGNIPGPGEILKQPVLAQTLKRLAEHGADDFYKGEIAQKIATDMESNGGWISLDDLNSFPDPTELIPLKTTFRDHTVYSQPPPCGGWTALLALNILENHSSDDLIFGSESRFQKVLQAIHLAHKDRKENPVTDLINYQEIIDQKISKEFAKQLLDNYLPPSEKLNEPEVGGETTHFSVVDKEGMAVAVTASINAYFGAAAASPDLGFLYNTYMDDFELGQPGHPFAIQPGLMNYSSMSPTIVQKDSATVLVIGSPGSARIISSVAQLTQLWIDSDLSIDQVVAAPRLHSVNGKVYYEDHSIPPSWLDHFRLQGFIVAFPTYDLTKERINAYFGGIHAIANEGEKWIGVADPRRDGIAWPANQ